VGTAIRTRAPSVFQDVTADPRFAPWREEAAKRGYASVLGLPLLAGAATLGALAIYASEPDAFDEEELALLRALADDLAYGIVALRTRVERARAEEALRKAHDELEQRVAERTDELTRANALLQQEVAERRRAEQELYQAKEAAEAANRSKSTFLAAMSHEIRTPMNAVLGMTELALDTDLTSEQREYLGLARQSAEALLTVINDILDFSKVEAGKLDLECAPFGLRACIGDTVAALGPRAHRKGLELACTVAAGVPDSLVGDAGRLRQVLMNLAGNGIKFTDKGEVVVSVSREVAEDAESPEGRREACSASEPSAPPVVCLRFEVRDTGIGIPADKRRLIFAPFSQVDTSLRRRYDGTGLGLAISRRLVELMGGEIAFESEAGEGSTFHFTARFELAPSPPEVPCGEVPAALRGLQVLVVDDNATSRRILTDLLSTWGMSPVGADGGQSALAALWRAAEAGRPFGLIVADAEMPDLGGLALAERLRREPGWDTPVIMMMLSSADLPSVSARCRELGVVACLTKPVRQAELRRAVLRALGIPDTGEQPADMPGRPGSLSQRPLRVLLAEDNPVNQKLAVTLLKKQGHTVVVAGAGAEVLAALQQQPFDLVLMDVQMPGMDGLETTAHIRAWEATTGAHVPVVAMTAYAMKGDRERCLAAGMDGYVAKPIRAQDLYDSINRAVGAGAVAVPNGDERPLATVQIDWASAREHVGGDEQLLRELARLFLTEHSRWLAELRQALASADAPALRDAAHRLKGALGALGAQAAFGEALRVEAVGRQGCLADAERACALLERELERLGPELAAFVQGA
jgi:signal transduction histidine kinase/CheY-like chemotaxis protein